MRGDGVCGTWRSVPISKNAPGQWKQRCKESQPQLFALYGSSNCARHALLRDIGLCSQVNLNYTVEDSL